MTGNGAFCTNLRSISTARVRCTCLSDTGSQSQHLRCAASIQHHIIANDGLPKERDGEGERERERGSGRGGEREGGERERERGRGGRRAEREERASEQARERERERERENLRSAPDNVCRFLLGPLPWISALAGEISSMLEQVAREQHFSGCCRQAVLVNITAPSIRVLTVRACVVSQLSQLMVPSGEILTGKHVHSLEASLSLMATRCRMFSIIKTMGC